MRSRSYGLSDLPGAVIFAGCLLVPLVVMRGNDDPWVLPRVVILWGLIVLCIGSLGAVLAFREVPEWRIPPCRAVDVPLGATAALIAVSTVLSRDVQRSVFGDRGHYQGALTFLLYGASFLVARTCLTEPRSVRRLWTAIAAGSIPVAAYAIGQGVGFDVLWGDEIAAERVFSTFGQPNALAAYLALCATVSIGLALDSAGPIRVLAVTAGTSGAVAVTMTGSRGGLLGLIGGVIVLALLTAGRGRASARGRKRLVGVGAATGAVALAVVTMSWLGGLVPATERIVPTRRDGTTSIGEHSDVWRVAADVAITHPLFGTGPDTFPEVFPAHSRRVLTDERVDHLDQFRVESPHNLFLSTAAGSGVFAMVGFAAFLASCAVVVLRADRRRSGARDARLPRLHVVVAGLTAFLIAHQFMSTDLTSSWLMMVLLGSGVGNARRDRPGFESD